MPIFEYNGKKYNVKDEHIDSFMNDFPDASTIMEREGKKYRVRSSDYNAFMSELPATGASEAQTPVAMSAQMPVGQKQTQAKQSEPEYVEGFGEGFKQGWQGLVSGSKYLVGEVANVFSGSSEDDKNALGRWDELQKKGVDIAAATDMKKWGEDAMVNEGGTLRALTQQEKRDYETIQEAIKDAGGDLDKARKLMEQRAKETTWGDSLKQEAEEEMNQMKPTKGFGAWVGNLAPQMLPSGAALALAYFTKNPKWAKMVGNIGMAGMTASTAGSTMKEARDAGASDMQVWGAGVADGTIEYLTEKLPFDKLTNRIFGTTKKKLSREIADGLADNPQTREEMERLLGEAANSVGLNWKQVGKSVLAQTTAEGLSEAAAGTLQTATQMIYQEPENYPTLYDYVTNAWEGAKAGMFMGAVLGAPVPLAQKVQNDKRRKQQGEVYVAGYINDNGETEVVEVVGSSKDGNLVVFGESGYKEISPEDVTYAHTFSYQEFKTGELEQEYDNGYNLETPQEMTDAKNMYDMQRQRVADALGDDVLSDIDRDPEAAIGKLGEDEPTNRTVIEYLNAKMVYDGMNKRVADDADARIAESDALVDSHTHKKTGMVQGATMKDEDRKVYIVNGNVVPLQDGTGIDLEASDNSIIIRDAESGELEQVSPEVLLSVDAGLDPTAEKQAAREAIESEVRANAERMQNGVVGFAPGDVYSVLGEDGNTHQVEIVQDNGDNTVTAKVDGEAVEEVMTKDQIQNEVDAYNKQRVVLVAQSAEDAENAEAAKPNYELNAHVTMQTPEGVVTGNINQAENDDNLIEVQVNKPFGGKKTVDMYTREELDNMVVEVADENGNVIWSKPAENAEAAANVQGAENVNTPSEGGAENVNTAPATPIVRGKHDQIDAVESIKAGTTPQQMADAYMQEYGDEEGLPLSTAQEKLAQVQEERQKTKDVDLKNGPLRKQEKFWNEVVDLLTPKEEALDLVIENLKPVEGNEQTQEAKIVDPTTMSDEEKQRRGDMLRNAPAVDVQQGVISSTPEMSARKAAEKWWDENVNDALMYNTEVGEVEINKNSIESSLAHRYGQRKLDAITSLVEGFENAVYLGTLPDGTRQEGVNNHYFAYPINYNGERCYVFCRAMQDANKNRLYVHEVFVEDRIKKGDTLQTAASQPHGGIALYKDILANVLDAPSEGKGTDKSVTAEGTQEEISENAQNATQSEQNELEKAEKERIDALVPAIEDVADDMQTADEFVAGLFGNGIRITPESFRKETGLGWEEQRRLVGIIAGKEKGGLTVEQAADTIVENYRDELAERGFSGDSMEMRDMVIDILSSGNPRAYAKQASARRAEQALHREMEAFDRYTQEAFHMSAEEYIMYEESMLPKYIEQYKDFDEQEYYSNFADEQSTQNEHDTTRESAEAGGSREILSEEQPSATPGEGTAGEGQQGGTLQGDVQGNAQEGLARAEAGQEGELASTGRLNQIREKVSLNLGDKYSLSSEQADNGELFYQGESGTTLAVIPDEIFDRMGISPVPFKLTESMGWHVYDHHKNETAFKNISDAIDFILSIINNVDHVRLGRDNSYIFSVENGRNKTGRRAVTIMINSKTGAFIGIKTSGYESIKNLKGRPLLWERGAETDPEDVASPTIATITPQQGDEDASRTKSQSNASSGYKDTDNPQNNTNKQGVISENAGNAKSGEQTGRTRFSTSTFEDAERIAREEQRRAPLRRTARAWEKILGVKVTLMERLEDVKDPVARREIEAAEKKGKKVPGWYSDTEGVFLYLPHVENENEVDKTCVHEIVSHKGLKELLGQEKFDELCSKVWDMMTPAERKEYMNYPNVETKLQAADEYIAHLSEEVELTARERSVWQKIMDFIADLLGRKADNRSKAASIVGKETLSRKDIAELVRLSYSEYLQRNGRESEKSGEGNNVVRFRTLQNERLRKLDEGETCNVERVFTQQKMFNFSSGEKIESYEDVAYIFRSLEDEAVENAFVALVKNGKPTIVHLGMGTATQTTVDQQAVIVAIERINPDAVYFVHNHPSGNLKASMQDALLLDSMKKAYGDIVKDGIIINLRSGKYYVFNEEGSNVEEASPNTPEKEIPAKTYSFSKRVFDKDFNVEELMPVTGPDAVDAYAREHGLVAALTSSQRLGERGKLSLLVISQGNKIVGNVFLNHTEVLPSNLGNISKEIAYYVSAMGGQAGILYGRFGINETRHLGGAVNRASAGSVRMLDAISMTEFGGYVSALDEGVMEETPSYGKGETRFRVTDDIEEVNARFNEELEKLNEENADRIILSLGRPSDILISAGVEDKPMKLYGNKVIKKMKKHGFSISELRNLPEAVADPIAVFDNLGREGNRSVLTELKTANGNFLVSLDLGKGEEIDFNIVSSVFGKGEDNIVDWIERGLSTYINKEKALNYLHHSALHAVALRSSRLDSAAKVIKDFQNPSVEGGIRFRISGDLQSEDGETISQEDVQASTLSYKDTITKALLKVAADHSEDVEALRDAMNSFGERIKSLSRIMSKQKAYDKATVMHIAKLAHELIDSGVMGEYSARDVKTMLTTLYTTTGRRNITRSANRLVDTILNHQIKSCEKILKRLVHTEDVKLNAAGVKVQGRLDVEGQRMMTAFRDGIKLDTESLAEKINEAQERMADSADDMTRREAEAAFYGLTLAKEYVENIKGSMAEEKGLHDVADDARKDYKEGRIAADARSQIVAEADAAIRNNKLERVDAYFALIANFGTGVRKSIERAREFREREIERVRAIQEDANRDMQGVDAGAFGKLTWLQRNLTNNPLVRFAMKPLATFDYMLRFFGKNSVGGEGFLWRRFMGQFSEASDKEWKNLKASYDILDAKVAEVFGKGMKWKNLFEMERNMPGATIKWWDGEKHSEFKLTQGNLLYIYMVDKMNDGRMKLRKMDIDENKVEEIKEHLDPRFVRLADWIQSEFLVSKWNEYNAVHERLFGASLDAIDNYFPLVINSRSRRVEKDIAQPEKGQTKPSTVTGAIIKRRRNAVALDLVNADAFGVVLSHLRDMEHWAAFSGLGKDLNSLLSYKRFRNQVMNSSSARYGAGDTLWDNFRDCCAIAAGSYRPRTNSDSIDRLAVNLSKGVTTSKIALRLYTAAKQLLSAPAFWTGVTPKSIMSAYAHPIKTWSWAIENLPGFAERWQGRTAGDYRLKESDMDWNWWSSTLADWLTMVGMTPNAFVDAVVVATGSKAVFDSSLEKYKKSGFSEDKAREKALLDAAVTYNETQQSGLGAYLSSMQVDRTVASVALTTFRNSTFAYTRKCMDSLSRLASQVRHIRDGYKDETIRRTAVGMMKDGLTQEQAERAAERYYRKETARDIANVVMFGFALNMLWELGQYLPYLVFGDDDEEKKDMAKNAAVIGALNATSGLTAGNIPGDLYRNYGKPSGYSTFQMGSMPILDDIQNTVKELPSDKVGAVSDMVNLLVAYGFGVNPQTVTDVVVAAVDASNGDMGVAKEIAFLVARMMSAPQSQLDKLYLDELGLNASEASKMEVEELAQRYADYKLNRRAPLNKLLYNDAEEKMAEYRYIRRFEREVKERVLRGGDEKANAVIDAYAESEEYEDTGLRVKTAKMLKEDGDNSKMKELSGTEEYKRYKSYEKYKSKASEYAEERKFNLLDSLKIKTAEKLDVRK